MTTYTKQHEAAERVELRRWLRLHEVNPVTVDKPNNMEILIQQVLETGGDPHRLMKIARDRTDKWLANRRMMR